jgi:hypothetical protein
MTLHWLETPSLDASTHHGLEDGPSKSDHTAITADLIFTLPTSLHEANPGRSLKIIDDG